MYEKTNENNYFHYHNQRVKWWVLKILGAKALLSRNVCHGLQEKTSVGKCNYTKHTKERWKANQNAEKT
jgi:hypothetical protein